MAKKPRKKQETRASINVRLGRQIRAFRLERRLSQQQLADQSGISVDAVGKVERGIYSPSLETVECIAAGLGVTIPGLMTFEERSAPRQNPPRSTARSQIDVLLADAPAAHAKAALAVLRALLRSLADIKS